MKKIIFAGFCMITSMIGICFMIFTALQLYQQYGTINGQSGLSLYLDLLNLMPVFVIFCILGIAGFAAGVWGIVVKDK